MFATNRKSKIFGIMIFLCIGKELYEELKGHFQVLGVHLFFQITLTENWPKHLIALDKWSWFLEEELNEIGRGAGGEREMFFFCSDCIRHSRKVSVSFDLLCKSAFSSLSIFHIWEQRKKVQFQSGKWLIDLPQTKRRKPTAAFGWLLSPLEWSWTARKDLRFPRC